MKLITDRSRDGKDTSASLPAPLNQLPCPGSSSNPHHPNQPKPGPASALVPVPEQRDQNTSVIQNFFEFFVFFELMSMYFLLHLGWNSLSRSLWFVFFCIFCFVIQKYKKFKSFELIQKIQKIQKIFELP